MRDKEPVGKRMISSVGQSIATAFGRKKSAQAAHVEVQDMPVGFQDIPNEILAQIAAEVATADTENWRETARNLNSMRRLNRTMRDVIDETPVIGKVAATLNEAGPLGQDMYKDLFPKGLLAKIRNIPEHIWGNRPSEVEKIRAVAPFLKLQPEPEVCRVVDIALAIPDPRSQAIATSLVAPTIDILPSQTQEQLIENALGHLRSADLDLNTNAGQELALAATQTIEVAENYLQPEQRAAHAEILRRRPELGQLIKDAREEGSSLYRVDLGKKGFQSEVDKALKYLGSAHLDTDLNREQASSAARTLIMADEYLQPDQRKLLDDKMNSNPQLSDLILSQKSSAGLRRQYDESRKEEESRGSWPDEAVRQRGIIGNDIKLAIEVQLSKAREMLKDRDRPHNTLER